jgi:hypothetical protein
MKIRVMDRIYYKSLDIIKLRDNMSVDELRIISNKTKEIYGFIDYKRLFITMGYTHAFGDTYYKEINYQE